MAKKKIKISSDFFLKLDKAMNSLRLTRLITGIPKVYLNLIKTPSTMILINSKYSTQIIKNTHKEEKRKNLFFNSF